MSGKIILYAALTLALVHVFMNVDGHKSEQRESKLLV